MNRDYIVEKHLLSRSYESQEKIDTLLEERYHVSGGQKPFIVFHNKAPEKPTSKPTLHNAEEARSRALTKERKYNTRNDLKKYFKQTTENQKKLIKKIQAHNRKKNGKVFPIKKLLIHYRIPEFEEFVPLNNLWQNYIQDLLFPNKTVSGLNVILPRLSSADFNGCLITVLQSKNSNLVGLRGIVICDTQHSFIVCVPRESDSKEWNENSEKFSPSEMVGGLRIVSKDGSLFGFDVILPTEDESAEEESIGFTVIGSRFEFRSSDRSGKKFKNHNVDDIL